MKKNDKQKDSWSSLLNDLGLEQTQDGPADEQVTEQAEVVETVTVKQTEKRATKTETVKTPPAAEAHDGFGAGLLDEPRYESPDESDEPSEPTVESSDEGPDGGQAEMGRGKKSFFDRFPKMNLFGAPPKESLKSVVEGTKKSPIGGKTFTSNTLEKVPHTKGRGSRKKEEPVEEKVLENADSAAPDAGKDDAGANPWSTIAAQVGVISTHKEPEAEPKAVDAKNFDRKKDGRDRKRGRRTTPSLFDEPVPEAEESKTLKNLMESDAPQERLHDHEAEKRLSSMFGEPARENREEKEEQTPPAGRSERQRGGRRVERTPVTPPTTPPVESETDDDPFEHFRGRKEPAKRSPAASSEEPRGRRGSKYAERDAKKPVSREQPREQSREQPREPRNKRNSESAHEEPAWISDREPQTTPSRRRGRRPESAGADVPVSPRDVVRREPAPTEPPAVPVQKSMPSWDDAIGAIIDANIARHNQRPRKNGGRR